MSFADGFLIGSLYASVVMLLLNGWRGSRTVRYYRRARAAEKPRWWSLRHGYRFPRGLS